MVKYKKMDNGIIMLSFLFILLLIVLIIILSVYIIREKEKNKNKLKNEYENFGAKISTTTRKFVVPPSKTNLRSDKDKQTKKVPRPGTKKQNLQNPQIRENFTIFDSVKEFFTNSEKKKPLYKSKIKFRAPPPLTKLKGSNVENSKIIRKDDKMDKQMAITNKEKNKTICERLGNLCEKELKTKVIDGNVLSFPGFFHADEKWPGCLPRPLYQGTCGSCWGFAASTCLSSRFYIESCGNTGCDNYPQVNFGSLNNVYNNINEIYKFRKLFLTDAFRFIDTNRNNLIDKNEWISVVTKYFNLLNDDNTPIIEKHYIIQVLTYILDFQSLGSISLESKRQVLSRAHETFDVWRIFTTGGLDDKVIDLEILEEGWKSLPINLSAEKIISCCIECIGVDYSKKTEDEVREPLMCLGGSLEDAWSLLRETGTPTALCIGYNMDDWREGETTPTCKEVQGPSYSFCSGYAMLDKGKRMSRELNKIEDSGLNPPSIPHSSQNLPWIDPQLFVFRAKNSYTIGIEKEDLKTPEDLIFNMESIQREILERGPVTTGYYMYPDFQYTFGQEGMGGQEYRGGNPLGSRKNSLIYMWDGKGEPLGGHAITIVGWGTYIYKRESKDDNGNVLKDKDGNSIMETDKIPYWICLNSWGIGWGHSGFSNYENRTGLPEDLDGGGYFWMVRGLNNCDIESNVTVGQPDLKNISYPGVTDKYGWGLPPPVHGGETAVNFLSPIKNEDLEVPENVKFIFDMAEPAGGTYMEMNKIRGKDNSSYVKDYKIKSMNPPSPYTLFWEEVRPTYCLGNTTEKLDGLVSDDVMRVDNDVITKLKKVVEMQPNPLLIVGNEQLQFIRFIEEDSFEVHRATNNSLLEVHDPGSIVQIMPYQELGVNDLSKIADKCKFDSEIIEEFMSY